MLKKPGDERVISNTAVENSSMKDPIAEDQKWKTLNWRSQKWKIQRRRNQVNISIVVDQTVNPKPKVRDIAVNLTISKNPDSTTQQWDTVVDISVVEDPKVGISIEEDPTVDIPIV